VDDLDQFGIEQHVTVGGPRTPVETEIGQEICSEVAGMS